MKAKSGSLYRILSKPENLNDIKNRVDRYKAIAQASANLKHCAACLANDFFKLTSKQWNNPAGSEYYAAMLAVIVHNNLY